MNAIRAGWNYIGSKPILRLLLANATVFGGAILLMITCCCRSWLALGLRVSESINIELLRNPSSEPISGPELLFEATLSIRGPTTNLHNHKDVIRNALLGGQHGRARAMTDTWIKDLVSAVDDDNDRPDTTCPEAATLRALTRAPGELRRHAQLAEADFANAGDKPLEQLRSDIVAADFRVTTDATRNLLVARMTVPGGPWPGHYGLEAVAFTAAPVGFPRWFPPSAMASAIHFGEVVAASNGFARGQGAVLFPELLSVREPRRGQPFGVVFVDRLTNLYEKRVAPVLAGFDGTIQRNPDVRAARELAFAAHEWGHLSGPVDYKATVLARRQRAVAIVSELHADLSALAMLVGAGSDEALGAAEMLLFDRIIREAWLPRAHSQVDGVAGRQLLTLLRDTQFLDTTSERPRFELNRAWPRLAVERDAVQDVEIQCASGDIAPAQRYLARFGWTVDERGAYRLQRLDDTAAELRRRSLDQLARL
jgi:hypothetical protein